MFLVHIHGPDFRRVQVDCVLHRVYTDNNYHVSDLRPAKAGSGVSPFKYDDTDFPSYPPFSTETKTEVETLIAQLETLNMGTALRAYSFAIATSFLLRDRCKSGPRSICWNSSNQFAMVGWGQESFGIKIRMDEKVVLWNQGKLVFEIVAPKTLGSRELDSVRDDLRWQFHQMTAYEMNENDIEAFSQDTDPSKRWRLVE